MITLETTTSHPVATLIGEAFATPVRLLGKIELLLDETIGTLQAVRPSIEAVGQAIDNGLLDDVRALVDQLESFPDLQSDVRAATDAAERLAGLVSLTFSPLNSIPGARRVTNRLSRGTAPAPIGS
ncbi:MAG: hypothetical protein ABIR57_07885 [Aeromicrobium sp.]